MKKSIVNFLIIIGAAFVVTLILMLGLAFLMLAMEVTSEMLVRFIGGIYFISTFVSGFLTGRVMETKKYLWGLAMGMLYFAIVFSISFICKADGAGMSVPIAFVLCACGGMAGGMIS